MFNLLFIYTILNISIRISKNKSKYSVFIKNQSYFKILYLKKYQRFYQYSLKII